MNPENKTRPSVSIVIPTYNERENIALFVPLLEKEFSGVPHEILVVDDSSPDGTGEEVLKLALQIPRLKLITRKEKTGIGSALRHGYNNAESDIILSSDSDLSFSTEDLMKLYQRIADDGYDVAIGSRHSADSAYETPRPGIALKYAISRGGNWLLYTLFRIPVKDFSANCRVIRRETWKSLRSQENTNFFLFEMIFLAHRSGARICEVPVTFLDRKYGISKINHGAEIFKAFCKMLLFLLRH